ncbi:MAG: GNAT family N-acetyltransferase [Candidatus Diapherotrites archaeon]|nr:GNAT family N-acetyltransferase [Candidatus Diapherotrites archaeon]
MSRQIGQLGIRICPAEKTELDAIYNLMKKEFPYVDDSLKEFEKRFDDKDVFMFCAFLNNEFAGFIDVQLTENKAIIVGLVVVPEFRNHSVGFRLTEKALDFFKEKQCTEVILEVADSNVKAVKLYENFGFRFLREGSNKPGPSSFLFRLLE